MCSEKCRRTRLIKMWEEEDEELRRLRRENADWEYIEKLPERIKKGVLFFIDRGDLRMGQKIAGLNIEEFIEILRRANVWIP